MNYQHNQATSILSTGSTEAFEKQRNALTPENFEHTRKEGDFDLISAVRGILQNAGIDTVVYDSSRIVIDANNLRPEAQRHLLNRFFRNQIMTVITVNSIEERTNLIDDGEIDDWIRLFTTSVVPFLVTHSLPKNLF